MPCEYVIDDTRPWVRARLWGQVTGDELRELRDRMAADPAFRPDLSVLIDLREVVSHKLTPVDIQDLARTSKFGSGSRRAFVTSQTVDVGLARMFQTWREVNRSLEQTAIFDTIAGAEAWLGSEPIP